MRKVLLVEYLPKGEWSNTKRLRDFFLNELSRSEVSTVNLLEDRPDYFSEESMKAYIERNYMGQELSEHQLSLLAEMDRHTQQLLENDIIVICAPMHNFGVPAAVKAWIDHVVMNGVTFGVRPDGTPAKFPDKRCLAIYTSGGHYSKEIASPEYPNWDTFSLTVKINFTFMGFGQVREVSAATNVGDKNEMEMAQAEVELQEIIKNWAL